MKKTIVIALLTSILFLSACSSVGNKAIQKENKQTISQKLTEGKTTKSEVQLELGEPSSISFTDSGNEVWTYRFTRSKAKFQTYIPIVNLFSSAASVKTKEIVILFDKDNIVSKYSMRETDDTVKYGIGG